MATSWIKKGSSDSTIFAYSRYFDICFGTNMDSKYHDLCHLHLVHLFSFGLYLHSIWSPCNKSIRRICGVSNTTTKVLFDTATATNVADTGKGTRSKTKILLSVSLSPVETNPVSICKRQLEQSGSAKVLYKRNGTACRNLGGH